MVMIFRKVVEAEEFLSSSSEKMINLISRDDINVPFEEKIFECVINWVKHELDCRYDSLPKLMEHVCLSLAPQTIYKNMKLMNLLSKIILNVCFFIIMLLL
ncbi:kelch-like protein 3 [Acyrthosiphon pisum]|uniref:BACK domain-containing protein n=1 Tax=Acyrthosiphon pisum TaxID=7029 RepID=A0A8R2NK60_ACYPI|nr:kelch-like protein 3 [Acyrthosiphon pisum]